MSTKVRVFVYTDKIKVIKSLGNYDFLTYSIYNMGIMTIKSLLRQTSILEFQVNPLIPVQL